MRASAFVSRRSIHSIESEKSLISEKSIDKGERLKLQSKELWKLQQLNTHLYSSIQYKDNLIERERKQTNQLKALITNIKVVLPNNKITKRTSVMKGRNSQTFEDQLFSSQGSVKKIGIKRSYLPIDPISPDKIRLPLKNSSLMSSVFSIKDSLKVTKPLLLEKESSYRNDSDQGFNDSKQQFQQQKDILKINNILNMQVTEEEALHQYDNDGNMKFVSSLLSDEDRFIKLVGQSGPQKLSYIHEQLKKLLVDHRSIFQMVLRLKTLINSVFLITSQSLVLDEALEKIVQQTVNSLGCDRSTCFVADHSKGELWSKVAQGMKSIIRFPISKGVAGYVATQKEIVNIMNAYSDIRFNEDVDTQSNYKTKTILAAPIMDKGECIGVLQCINKFQGFFTKEDESLIKILCDFSQVVLKNTLNKDHQVSSLNKLRQTIKGGIFFQMAPTYNDRQKFVKQAEIFLKSIMSVDLVRIVIRKGGETQFYDENDILICINNQTGIINHSINTMKQISIFNPTSNPLFCPRIDLDTSLPIICQPVMRDGVPIGGIMVVNFKGLLKQDQYVQPRVAAIDSEVLGYFTQQLAIALQYFE